MQIKLSRFQKLGLEAHWGLAMVIVILFFISVHLYTESRKGLQDSFEYERKAGANTKISLSLFRGYSQSLLGLHLNDQALIDRGLLIIESALGYASYDVFDVNAETIRDIETVANGMEAWIDPSGEYAANLSRDQLLQTNTLLNQMNRRFAGADAMEWNQLIQLHGDFQDNLETSFYTLVVLYGVLLVSLLLLGWHSVVRRQFEANLNASRESIERINDDLRQSNEELKRAQDQLFHSAKLASLGELATGIAHELNNPLAIISMHAEIGADESKNSPSKTIKDSFNAILQQVRRASSVVDHVRRFGQKNTSGAAKRVSVNTIIENAFVLCQAQLRSRGIQLIKDLSAIKPIVDCNAVQLEQVFRSLLNNARDALRQSSNKVLTVRSFIEGDQVVIEFEDNGHGIPKAQQHLVFQPFFSTKPSGEGAGLGLSTSYSIVKSQQGSMSFTSTPHQGTVFRVELPLAQSVVVPFKHPRLQTQ